MNWFGNPSGRGLIYHQGWRRKRRRISASGKRERRLSVMGKEAKELTVVEKREVQPVSVTNRGMENANFDQSDFIIPRAKIVQALSREATEGDIRPGTMVNTATGEIIAQPEETFRVQTIMVSVGQVYIADKELSCYSPDGIKGIGNPGGDCAACPL